jgi:hypothetical protein
MTSEGNVADTGIVQKVNQLLQTGQAPDIPTAFKMLKEQARRDRDKEEMEKIKTTQKAFDERKSRRSGNKKKMKKKKK